MTPEALLALLRSHQDGVYTVCLHVLRNSHDAEDAAQESMLKIASSAKDLRDPRAFKSWLYRLVFRIAVDHLRKRATRRRIEEGSVPMSPAPLTDEQRDAIHEAMAALPDDDRLMLVEHYFEKVPIVELGRREGISDVAMGKRLEKARERLKQGLSGAGILVGASQVSHALESVSPASAPSGLIGSAIVSKAALVAAGGIAVSAKTTTSIVVIAASILLIALLTGSISRMLAKPAQEQDSGINNQRTTSSSAGAKSAPLPIEIPEPTVGIDKTKGDPAACRKALAALLPYVRTTDMLGWADRLERLHEGGNRRFEAFARDFITAAGSDLVPIVKAMLAEAEADTAKFLLCAILGRAHDPAGMEILKGLTQGSHYAVTQSALYSIGLIRTPDGLSFLKSSWDQVKSTKSPVVATTLKAIGLFGAESIPVLLEAANSNSGVFRDKASYLFLVRGKDAVEGLRLLIETESDGSVRTGAAQALAYNLEADQGEVVVDLFKKYSDAEVRGGLLYGLMFAWKPPLLAESRTPARTAIADSILTQASFPTGSLDVDRALVWLSIVASPEGTAALFERFSSMDKEALGPNYKQLVREMMSAYSNMPAFNERLTSLMNSAGFSPEERERMRSKVALNNSPEQAAAVIKINLETLRDSPPGDSRIHRAVNNLVRSETADPVLSSALREAYDRCPTPEARIHLMDSLTFALYSTNESVAPRTFLEGVLLESAEVDVKLFAAYSYLAPGSTGPVNSRVLDRIAELIGPGMKWAGESTLSKGDFRMVQVAPTAIGDYYSQFGKSSDITWLKQVPENFPYPPALPEKARELLKRDLELECRRAIDAIRLKN